MQANDANELRVGAPPQAAAGPRAVAEAMRQVMAVMPPSRALPLLMRVNQSHGFDCPGCAWPEPSQPSRAEFCENGAKALAAEATTHTVDAEFFARHSVADLLERSDHWLGSRGRLARPMFRREGATNFEPIEWHAAFALVAERLRALPSPDAAAFYTSGRTSNEAAFLYQFFARRLGTNNLPDCSDLCHESSGMALTAALGVSKGSVTHDDFAKADLIVVVGQNPGTNHPRMLSTLRDAVRAGAQLVSVNPLPEVALARFRDPQAVSGWLGSGDALASTHLPVRLGGDQALFAAVTEWLLAQDLIDHEFVAGHTQGFQEMRAQRLKVDWEETEAATGLDRTQIESFAQLIGRSQSIIVCWAVGLTQHVHAVDTIREVVNVLLLRGSIGRPGAGVCPVRGHSNVQGDRTMGIAEKMPDDWLDRLGMQFGFDPPRERGLDVLATIAAMQQGDVRVLVALGGNFARATPDTRVTEAALASLDLCVNVATTLNRTHLVAGRESLILPCLGRTDLDLQNGRPQAVTVEDSMGMVHASVGGLAPVSPYLRSEVAIVAGLGEACLPEAGVDWREMSENYSLIRDRIAAVVPGFERFNDRIRVPGGFALPHPVRDSCTFPTASGRAEFAFGPVSAPVVAPGRLLLQTLRSHDQFNTTVYGLDDRYRGIHGGRNVVFVNAQDRDELGLREGQLVDVIGEWHDGERRMSGVRLVTYAIARGCAAAYFPEANVLLPLDHKARGSNTPAAKSIVVRLEAAGSIPGTVLP